MKNIERIVREHIPHRDAIYIPDLVKELEAYCREKENENFNAGLKSKERENQ